MKTSFIILTFLFAVLNSQINAQDTSLFKYFPLKVNNVWVYYGSGGNPNGHGTWFDRYKLTSAIQINNKTYFVVQLTKIVTSSYGYFNMIPIRVFYLNIPIRIDSANLNIYKSTNCGIYSELPVDSLRARKNDTSSTCDFHGNRVICTDTSLISIFNANRRSKRFEIHDFEGGNSQTYVKDIGVTEFHWSQLMEGVTYNLRGCVINGVVYGDTSMVVGIRNLSQVIPGHFSLSQNYPNPFNPVTKIKFAISLSRGVSERRGVSVSMIIYDAIGREITTLINEELKPGTYEVEWDASNYTSGVYFYKLITADYSETRKMVLVK
jgi:Secretion system C-terminal sorting domain